MQVPEQAPSDVPAGLPVQVPRLPEILHAWQAGQDEDMQHTLSVQVKPVPHWLVVVHEAPLVPRAAQSFPAELQPFAQVVVGSVVHWPLALHKWAGVKTPPAHLGPSPQAAPALIVQAPALLQVPFWQLAAVVLQVESGAPAFFFVHPVPLVLQP
jgi:hypothetical protein